MIVAGGRDVTSYDLVATVIAASEFEITEVVSGCARGADRLGEQWARLHQVPVQRFPADWNRYGRSAGVLRNQTMASYADALIAISTGGPGTANMILEAKRRGLKVHVFNVPRAIPA